MGIPKTRRSGRSFGTLARYATLDPRIPFDRIDSCFVSLNHRDIQGIVEYVLCHMVPSSSRANNDTSLTFPLFAFAVPEIGHMHYSSTKGLFTLPRRTSGVAERRSRPMSDALSSPDLTINSNIPHSVKNARRDVCISSNVDLLFLDPATKAFSYPGTW